MSTSDLIGKTIGQYQIVEQIGLGGMATIFKAYQPSIDRYVALKILPRHLANDPNFVKRFQHEAKSIAALEHPHILPVHDFGTDSGYTYMVMRYVKGGTLADLMGNPLPYDRIIQIVRNVARALDYAHSNGVVHRDIKPSNILIDKHDSELLTDFGIAKMVEDSGGTQLTSAGSILGTPAYMAPEQAAGKPVDGRTDIYSLGVVLYELLVGKPPYQAETPLAVVLKHLNDPLPPPRSIKSDIPNPLERVVLKAMAKNPDDRYQTAADMEKALKVALRQIEVNAPTAKVPAPASRTAQVSTPPPAPAAKPGKKGVLTPILFIGGLLVVLLCLVGGGILTWALLRDPTDYDSVTPTTVAVSLPEEATPVPTATSAPALPTFTPAPTAPPGDSIPTSPPVLDAPDFFDNFSDNRNNWFEGDNSDEYGDYNAEIVDGRYRLSQQAAKSVFSWELPQNADFDNFIMSVDVTPVQFNEAFAFGLIFRVVDNQEFYAFEVDSDGYFFINLYQDGDWQTLVDFTEMTAIDGENTNHLMVKAVGSTLSFYINDEEAITIEDKTLSRGAIGVAFELYEDGNTATVDFDNLQVQALDATAEAAPPATAAGEILLAEYFDSNANGWATGYFEDERTTDDISLVDGRYRMSITARDQAYVERILPNQDFSDFSLSLEATPLDTAEHYSYGLAFREDEFSLSAYTFEIGNDGLYSVQLYDGEWQVLQDWTYTDAIKVGETNDLRIIANGNVMTFLVNGQELTTIEDDTLSSGTVALVVDMFEADQSATVDFDNLIISALE